MIECLSPNFDERPLGMSVGMLVLHYTGMKTAQEAIARLCSAEAKVSSHYLVHEDGQVVHMVREEKRAWHAGISCWQGVPSCNDLSIGIEIVNPGHEFGYRPFPAEQMDAVSDLAFGIIKRHKIRMRNIVAHSDIAPTRKEDPGELFGWQKLASEGIGLWPDVDKIKQPNLAIINPGEESLSVARVQKMLADYGYYIKVDGIYGPKTELIIKAFKRRFVPENLNVVWDNMADARLKNLLEMVGEAGF
jgi:N-acetylmuramoyl-L-alanine amidase